MAVPTPSPGEGLLRHQPAPSSSSQRFSRQPWRWSREGWGGQEHPLRMVGHTLKSNLPWGWRRNMRCRAQQIPTQPFQDWTNPGSQCPCLGLFPAVQPAAGKTHPAGAAQTTEAMDKVDTALPWELPMSLPTPVAGMPSGSHRTRHTWVSILVPRPTRGVILGK